MKRTANTATLKSVHDAVDWMLVGCVQKTDLTPARPIGKREALLENYPQAGEASREMLDYVRPRMLFVQHPAGNRAARRAAKGKTQ